jgi:hypothetical protein
VRAKGMATCADAVREVVKEPDKIYSNSEVIDLIYQKYTERPWKDVSIRCHLIGLSINHPSSIHYPTLHRQAFLFSLGRGNYRLYDPEKDGNWIVDKKGTRLVDDDLGEVEDEESLVEASFTFERDLEDHIFANLNQIEEGLQVYSEEGVQGRQYTIDVGRIDILALDKNSNFVVIELKVGEAKYHAIGQILSYMSWVRKNLAGEREVRGLIIADDFDQKLRYATSELDNLELKKYMVSFDFESVAV